MNRDAMRGFSLIGILIGLIAWAWMLPRDPEPDPTVVPDPGPASTSDRVIMIDSTNPNRMTFNALFPLETEVCVEGGSCMALYMLSTPIPTPIPQLITWGTASDGEMTHFEPAARRRPRTRMYGRFIF